LQNVLQTINFQIFSKKFFLKKAFVMKLVDILVLGTSALVRVGSNPTEGIFFESGFFKIRNFCKYFEINWLFFKKNQQLKNQRIFVVFQTMLYLEKNFLYANWCTKNYLLLG
jgi:hypothetical protein